MSQALGGAVWSTYPVPEDVSGECRYIQVLSKLGNLRIMTIPGSIDSAARAVVVLSGELRRRKARADYGAKH